MLLKNNHGKPRKKNLLDRALSSFNSGFEKATGKYIAVLKLIVNRKTVTWGILIVFSVGIYLETKILPSGFIPNEDQGTIYAIIQTPPGATLERTNQLSRDLQEICEEIEGIESVSALAGL